MKKLLLFIAVLCFGITQNVVYGNPVKVLFLGNSYTFVNDLPEMFRQVVESAGDSVIVSSYSQGGYRFSDFVKDPATYTAINSDTWDYVVLQGQSQETSWSEEQMATEVYPYVATLCDSIRNSNACTIPILFMTWGRKYGDAQNAVYLPYLATYEGMDNAIRKTYIYLAEANNTDISPVGAVWRYINNSKPDFDLFSNDGSHPSAAGTFAAACTFYSAIYKTRLNNLSFIPTETDSATVATIIVAVNKVVADSLDFWSYTENPATAVFTYQLDNKSVTFDPTGSVYDSLLWNFGDGNTSTAENPHHEYTDFGKYNVSLTTFMCHFKSEISQEIDVVDKSSVDDPLKPYFAVTPDGNLLTAFNIPDGNFSVWSASGKCVKTGEQYKAGSTIDISQLASGVYVFKCGIYSYKFLKH